MASNIVTARTFEPASLICLGLRNNANGRGKSVNLRYNCVDLLVRTPKMFVPVVWENADNPDKFSVELSFRGMDENPDLRAFYDTIRAIESRALDFAHEHAVEWFKAKPNVTRDAIEMLFSSSLREPSEYPASMRVTAYLRSGVPTFRTYDGAKDPVTLSSIMQLKGNDAIAGIECTGIWISGSKFGLTWKLTQIRLYPRAARADGGGASRADAVVARPAAEIDLADVTFSAPKMTNNGGRIVYVNHGATPLVVRTPMLYAPFGMGVWNDDAGGPKYSLDLSLRDYDSESETKVFYDFIAALEAKVKAESNASGWFRNGAAGAFGSVLKHKNPNHPPTMKFNVPAADSAPLLDIVDETGLPVDTSAENIPIFSGARISLEAQCTGVWMHGGRFGISFRALRGTIVPSSRTIDLVSDEDDHRATVNADDASTNAEDDAVNDV